jgi:aspartyl-tRNA(Asn)/glutamyl-tRNA(Gln) amidotransferase subunit C
MTIDIDKIAKLARLTLGTEEKKTYVSQLTNILSLAEQMDSFKTQDIKPLAHPLDATQPMRPDVAADNGLRDTLQTIAPRVEAGLYLVPQVIESD